MALDPTKVANKSTALAGKRTDAFENVAANLNLAVLRIDEFCPDPDTAKRRGDIAIAILRGDETELRQTVFSEINPEDRKVIEEVYSGTLTKANLDQLRQQQTAQPTQAPQAAPQQPQVIQGSVVPPTQELTDAVNTSATAAATAATEVEAIKAALQTLEEAIENDHGLFGNKKEIQKQLDKLKAKLDAAVTAAGTSKAKADDAKAKVAQANPAPATQALPAAPTP